MVLPFHALKTNLSKFDKKIKNIEPIIGPKRQGDIPRSQASIGKAISVFGYKPYFDAPHGFEKACGWYWKSI